MWVGGAAFNAFSILLMRALAILLRGAGRPTGWLSFPLFVLNRPENTRTTASIRFSPFGFDGTGFGALLPSSRYAALGALLTCGLRRPIEPTVSVSSSGSALWMVAASLMISMHVSSST